MARMNFGRVKPTFMIIGTQKGGTTALHSYLLQHPKLIAPAQKELHFFDTFESRPISDYLKQFPKEYFGTSLSFESTPRYIYYPGVAEKIYSFDPKIKFIVVLRDPVKRAYSAWNMYKQLAHQDHFLTYFKNLEAENPKEQFYSLFYQGEFPTFEAWVRREIDDPFVKALIEPSILGRGYYKEQITKYLSVFPREQFYFADSKELKNNTLKILNEIALFLEIQDFGNIEVDLSLKHQRKYEDPFPVELYRKLLLHFQNKNKGLESLISLNLEWMKPFDS